MIGLSLSQCIGSILRGEVSEEKVEKIISGTCFKSDDEFALLSEEYVFKYWDNNTEGVQILIRLKKSNKIIQPRLTGGSIPSVAKTGSCWVTSESEIQYC